MSKELTPLETFYILANTYQYAFQEIHKEETKIIETGLKRLEWYETYYTNYVKDLEKSNHKLNDVRVKKEKQDEVLRIIKRYILKDLQFDDEERAIIFRVDYVTLFIVIGDETKYNLLKEGLKC